MRIEQLEYLTKLVKYDSMNKAAEDLYLSPQGLSKLIRTMEKEIGFKLLHKCSQGIHFTAEGLEMVKCAQTILDTYYGTLAVLRNQEITHIENLSGILKIYSNSVYINFIFPHIISQFMARYPKVKISILPLKEEKKRYCEPDEVCIYSTRYPGPETLTQILEQFSGTDMTYHPLKICGYFVYVSQNSELANQETVSLKTVLKYPIVRFSSTALEQSILINEILESYGKSNIVLSTESLELWRQSIESGCVGLLNDGVLNKNSSAWDVLQKLHCCKIKERHRMILGITYPDQPSAIVRAFIKYFPEMHLPVE